MGDNLLNLISSVPTTNHCREVFREKSRLLLDNVQKKGGGVQFKSKSFGVFFLDLLLDITEERRGGLNLFHVFGSFWGSLEVVLRHSLGCFEVFFSCNFFCKSVQTKVTPRLSKTDFSSFYSFFYHFENFWIFWVFLFLEQWFSTRSVQFILFQNPWGRWLNVTDGQTNRGRKILCKGE